MISSNDGNGANIALRVPTAIRAAPEATSTKACFRALIGRVDPYSTICKSEASHNSRKRRTSLIVGKSKSLRVFGFLAIRSVRSPNSSSPMDACTKVRIELPRIVDAVEEFGEVIWPFFAKGKTNLYASKGVQTEVLDM